MSGKTIFIIAVTVLATLVLVNNTDDMELWIFGATKIPKLAVLGVMLILGFTLGFMAGRPRKKVAPIYENYSKEDEQNLEPYLKDKKTSQLSDEDRDYIS